MNDIIYFALPVLHYFFIKLPVLHNVLKIWEQYNKNSFMTLFNKWSKYYKHLRNKESTGFYNLDQFN